jgi:alkylated DNA repair protein (DNA oxidative demethylase)
MNGPPGPSPSGPPRCRVATRCRSGPSASAGTSSHRRETPVSQTVSVSPSSPAGSPISGQAAISAIYGPLAAAAYRPDTALVNYYDPGPRPWGGESISDLAVSLSLGDRCSFQLSNTGNHGYPCTDLTLSSGDTLVFGRQARFACQDEPRIYPGTGHPRSGLTRGRINITMRMTVLGSQ